MRFIVKDNGKGLHGGGDGASFEICHDEGKGVQLELSWDLLPELEFILANLREEGERRGMLAKRGNRVEVKVKNTPEGRAEVARMLVTSLGEARALVSTDGELHEAVHREIERRKRS